MKVSVIFVPLILSRRERTRVEGRGINRKTHFSEGLNPGETGRNTTDKDLTHTQWKAEHEHMQDESEDKTQLGTEG